VLYPLARNRMVIGNPVAVQIDVIVRVSALKAVLGISAQGRTDGRQLAADLVLAAGFQRNGQQVVAVAAADVFVAQLGEFGAGARVFVDGGAVAGGIFEVVLQGVLVFFGAVGDDGEVVLTDRSGLQLLGQRGLGGGMR